MAITRQDYQYIRNTLPSGASKNSDGTLTVGETVVNLLPELNEYNLYNPNYQDFYGDKTSQLSSVWFCPPSGGRVNTIIFKPEVTAVEKEISHNKVLSGVTGVWAERDDVGNSVYVTTIETYIDPTAIPESVTATIGSVRYNSENGLVRVKVSSPMSGTLVKTILTYNTKRTEYEVDTNFSFKDYGISTSAINVIDTNDIQVTGDFLSGSCEVEKTDDDILISIKMVGPTPELAVRITYKLTSKYILEDTILQGLLSTQILLEKDTSYVLQVVDSTKPKMDPEISLKVNNIQGQTSGLQYEFNQYLFFHTSDEEVFDINIFGLSFGYKLYHAERDENDDVYLLQLRSISSPVQAKVFLFKSDLPWIVNKNGMIVGLNNASLEIPQEASRTCQSGILTKKEIQDAFSEAPVVDIKNDQLIVWLPDTGNTSTQWKYTDLWNGTRLADNAPAICRQIRLFVLRDFLITEERDYNNQEIRTRRGIIRTLQRNQKNNDDYYSPSVDINVFTGFGKIAPITVGDIAAGQTYISLDFDKGTTTNDNGEKELIVNENNGVAPVSMPLLSLLGYNYEFCKDQGHLGSSSINPYQYTSVCFAWGYERKKGVFSLISGCSQPILIDRGLVSISKNEEGQIVLTFGDVAAYKEKVPYYGEQDIFCIRAKDIEIEETTEE